METKDLLYVIGISVTFLLGVGNILYNLYINKKTIFINTVTAERIKWIGKLRENISAFCGLSYHWVFTGIENQEKSNELIKEIDRLRVMIKLQLNPNGTLDIRLMSLIDEIVRLSVPKGIPNLGEIRANFEAKVNEMIQTGQLLLKAEWEKAKEESKKGDLRRKLNSKPSKAS
jgi:hypothetical protein